MKIYVVIGYVYDDEGTEIIMVSTNDFIVKAVVEERLDDENQFAHYDEIKIEVWENDAYIGYLDYNIKTVVHKEITWEKIKSE